MVGLGEALRIITARLASGVACNAAGAHARLRSMQTLLDTLMARARDKTSWTRACVCRTWGVLAEGGKVPMGHWNAVAEVAIGARPVPPFSRVNLACVCFRPVMQGPITLALTLPSRNVLLRMMLLHHCGGGSRPLWSS